MKYFISLLLLFPCMVMAAWEPTDGLYKITEIVVEGDHNGPRVYLKVSPPVDSGECTNKSAGLLIRLEPNSAINDNYQLLYQQLYSAAFSAYVAQSEIKLKMNGCDDWDRPRAIAVWLK